MEQTTSRPRQSDIDEVLGFTIEDRDCRGRFVRLGPVLETILSAHDYAPVIKRLLAEAMVLTSLMGSLLKGAGDQLTLQAQSKDGVVNLLVCDFQDGEMRGYVQYASTRGSALLSEPMIVDLFGDGYLAITFDISGTAQRYQGLVPFEGNTLTQAVEAYFARSEQIPTLIRTAVRLVAGSMLAGGLLLQHLADGEVGRERLEAGEEHPEWEHLSIIAQSSRADELVEPGSTMETVIWRLYQDKWEVRLGARRAVTRGCRCSTRRFEEVLARFPSENRREMRNDENIILLDCAFCSRIFAIQD